MMIDTLDRFLILTDAQLAHLDTESRNEYLEDLKAALADDPDSVQLPDSDELVDDGVSDDDYADALAYLREEVLV